MHTGYFKLFRGMLAEATPKKAPIESPQIGPICPLHIKQRRRASDSIANAVPCWSSERSFQSTTSKTWFLAIYWDHSRHRSPWEVRGVQVNIWQFDVQCSLVGSRRTIWPKACVCWKWEDTVDPRWTDVLLWVMVEYMNFYVPDARPQMASGTLVKASNTLAFG